MEYSSIKDTYEKEACVLTPHENNHNTHNSPGEVP